MCYQTLRWCLLAASIRPLGGGMKTPQSCVKNMAATSSSAIKLDTQKPRSGTNLVIKVVAFVLVISLSRLKTHVVRKNGDMQ